MRPFFPPYSQSAVDDLRNRLRRTRWPESPEDAGWMLGTDLAFLQTLCAWWAEDFDWQAELARISAYPHFLFTAKEGDVHFLHVKGTGPAPMPLILTHGWPGSFIEMLKIVPLLVNPAANGGDPADAFDVVVPSLPGFGYSMRPRRLGMGVLRVAAIWTDLMEALGYMHFAVQGGDIGAGVSTMLGLRHSQRVIGVHLNFIPGSYRPFVGDDSELTEAEKAWPTTVAAWSDSNGAYSHMQATRPQTAAFGLNDSPAGLAAWIVEKFRAWSDCDGDVLRSFTRNELLANITLYWMTETIGSSFLMYYEGRQAPLRFGKGDRVQVPCAVAQFPREIAYPPRTWVERGYNLQRWTVMPKGGHFAAAEQPHMLAEDIRAFFRPLR